MIDTVSEYAQAGFCMFPLITTLDPKMWKHPTIKEWEKTPYDPNLDREVLPGNFGVVIGPEYLVIDVDVKNNQPGLASFEKLTFDAELKEGWEIETFCVQTGSGGFHIYLKKPKDFQIKKNNPKYPGIDFLTGNMYVVGAGSLHPETGAEYRVCYRSPMQIAPAPARILNLLLKREIIELAPAPEVTDDDPVNIERFIEILAQMPPVPQGNQRNSCYLAACKGRDLGLSLDVCCSTLHTHYNGVKLDPPIQKEEVDDTVKNAYRYAQGKQGSKNVAALFQTAVMGEPFIIKNMRWVKNKDDQITVCLVNAVNHIASTEKIRETFRFNAFSQQIELSSKAPWFDERGHKCATIDGDDFTLLRHHLARTFFIEYKKEHVKDAVIVVAKKRHYHPVQNYLKNLVWDGVPRIETWLIDYAKTEDNVYTRAVSKKFLCAAVRRVFEPGCKFDHVLILEGVQGARKSTLCSVLGRLWYGDMNIDPHHKDSLHNMFGKWIIELSEMTALKWAGANALKAFLSRSTDIARLSYAETSKDYPRQSVFIGTINPEHMGYLNDSTGNRRYWIVSTPCTKDNQIDVMGLEMSCDQLWAEAYACYQTEPLYLTGEAEKIQQLMTEARMPEEPYVRTIEKFVVDNPDTNELQTQDILDYMGVSMKGQTRLDMSRVAAAFEKLGWERSNRRERGRNEIWFTKPLADRIKRETEKLETADATVN